MTESTGGSSANQPARWGIGACLAIALLMLAALDPLPLVLIPLALLLLATPVERRWRWIAGGVLLGMLGLAAGAGSIGGFSRAWALLVGSVFLAITFWRPRWPVLKRSLTALAAAGSLVAAGLGISGAWRTVDQSVRQYLAEVSSRAFAAARESAPEAGFLQELASAAGQVAQLQAELFPALIALQTLAALGLAAWLVSSFLGHREPRMTLRPWREFRFNDQLVWVLIAGLALVLLPLGEGAARVGYNAVFFMAVLYALRGIGVFLFVSVGASRLVMLIFGALAAIFLYPLILGAAILLGLGDTWLDVRGRAIAASGS